MLNIALQQLYIQFAKLPNLKQVKSPIYLLLLALCFSLSLFIYPTPTTLAQACPADDLSKTIKSRNGLLTIGSTVGTDTGQFTANDKCIISNRALIPQFGIPTYAELKSIYYDQAGSIIGKVNKQPKIVGNADHTRIVFPGNEAHLYWVENGDLNIGGGITGPSVGIIFVDGNLNITSNIIQGGNNARGIVFVVRGSVRIRADVTRVESVLIDYTDFCSAYNFNTSSCPPSQEAQTLTIQGAVMHLNPSPTSYPRFIRTRNDPSIRNTQPSEDIIYDPKYLVLLKDIMSRSLTVWSEK